VPAIRAAVGSLDPDVALDRLQTLREAHAADLGGLRFVTGLFASFGLLALALSVSGVYGLVAYTVTRRTREIGMRLAMGATAARVHRGMLRDSVRLALVGVVAGSGLAYAAARVLAAALGEAAVIDVGAFAGVVALLLAAVALATWFPALRVSGVDPAEALRSE
jgi:ABC-type antimicrobial peptide transport system permease subunit